MRFLMKDGSTVLHPVVVKTNDQHAMRLFLLNEHEEERGVLSVDVPVQFGIERGLNVVPERQHGSTHRVRRGVLACLQINHDVALLSQDINATFERVRR